MKRVLLVAYHFPPSGSVAAHRPHKFARHLPEFGWRPSVLCREPDPMHPRDESFLGEIDPSCDVTRLDPSEPLRLLGALGGFGRRLRDLCTFPDEHAGWRRALRRALPQAIREVRPEAMVVSSVPLGSLIVATEVGNVEGVPVVVDFHNEWTGNLYYRPATRRQDRRHREAERCVIEAARAVVTLNPLHTQDLRRRFPGKIVETVENGFESSDYEIVSPPPRGERLVLAYAGAAYGYQNPDPFLRALEPFSNQVDVRIFGDPFRDVPESGRPFPFRVERDVPHRDLPARLTASDGCFLFLGPEAARQLPAKIYEYMAARRPVLAMVPSDGAAAGLVRRTGCGVVVPSERPELWNESLAAFLRDLRSGSLEGRFVDREIRGYQRRELARKLAGLLDSVTTAAPAGSPPTSTTGGAPERA